MEITAAITSFAVIATWIVRRFVPKMPKALLPHVAIVVATLVNIAVNQKISSDEITMGVVEGLLAAGLWSAGARKLLPTEDK